LLTDILHCINLEDGIEYKKEGSYSEEARRETQKVRQKFFEDLRWEFGSYTKNRIQSSNELVVDKRDNLNLGTV
jgi:hypothetical protein